MTDQPPDGDESWVPPMWPRYAGIAVLTLVLLGCVAFVVAGLRAVAGEGGGNDFFLLVLGAVGIWYVGTELRQALARLQAARDERPPDNRPQA